jgi:preprotein translocase subunit SecG
MGITLSVLLFILAVFLIVLILKQPDRSNGMAASFGSGSSNTMFGVEENGGTIAKITEIVAVLFVVVALVLYVVAG